MERELEKYKDEDDKRDIEYLDEILRRAAQNHRKNNNIIICL